MLTSSPALGYSDRVITLLMTGFGDATIIFGEMWCRLVLNQKRYHIMKTPTYPVDEVMQPVDRAFSLLQLLQHFHSANDENVDERRMVSNALWSIENELTTAIEVNEAWAEKRRKARVVAQALGEGEA